MRESWLAALGVLASVGMAAAQGGPLTTITLPRAPTTSITVMPLLPAWVAMPTTARILTSEGLAMRPLRNSAVTWENAKIGFLVGALGNAGGCARDVRAFLQYTDDRWQPMGEPIESEARVDHVDPGGVLPYRFRLKRAADFAVAPSGYILQVVEDGKPVADTLEWVSTTRKPMPPAACAGQRVSIDAVVTQSRGTWRGYRVAGTLTLRGGGPLRPEAITVTALLRDAAGEVLEVISGVPEVKGQDLPSGLIENGQVLTFAISTDIPLGGAVARTEILTGVLDEARSHIPE